jgi:hypothetical protein
MVVWSNQCSGYAVVGACPAMLKPGELSGRMKKLIVAELQARNELGAA